MSNERIETLLSKFINEGTTSIKEIRDKVTEMQVQMSSMREKIDILFHSMASEKTDRKERTEELKKGVENNKEQIEKIRQYAANTLNEFEKRVIGLDLESNAENLEQIKDEIAEVEKRLGEVEQKMNRWVGALSVVVTLLVMFLGIFEKWAGGVLLPFIFF